METTRGRFFLGIFLLFLILISSLTVFGRYISLSTQASTEKIVYGNETQLNVKLINSGDESAYDVQVSLILPEGFEANSLFFRELMPNSPYEGTIKIKINENLTPGEYPIGILTDYKDANGYPFSSISSVTLFFKKQTSSQVFGILQKIKISSAEGEKELMLKIRNLDSKQHSLKIKLFLPRELKSDITTEKIMEINSKEEKEIKFKISNFGALPGSTYIIFATLEYDDKDDKEKLLHFSSIILGIVEIVEEREEERKDDKKFQLTLPTLPSLQNMSSTWIPLAALILLILIFILYQFKAKQESKKKKRKKWIKK